MSTVPPDYIGLWKRRGIWRSDGSSDLGTRVLWFQSAEYHIDLRIPADRPALPNAVALARLTPGQRQRMEAQIAFAGRTVVEGARCTWLPRIAFPAVSAELDAGWMRFDAPGRLHETGIDNSYEEEWERIAAGPVEGRCVAEADGMVSYVLESGDWLAWARGRPGDAFPVQWSEFCFAQREGAGWRIVASSQPWREGELVTDVTCVTWRTWGQV